MANRTHSQTENSRDGRHLSIETIRSLIDTFNKSISDHLTEDDIVRVSLDETSYSIFSTFFKWFPYTITNDQKVKTTNTITLNTDNIVVLFNNDVPDINKLLDWSNCNI